MSAFYKNYHGSEALMQTCSYRKKRSILVTLKKEKWYLKFLALLSFPKTLDLKLLAKAKLTQMSHQKKKI